MTDSATPVGDTVDSTSAIGSIKNAVKERHLNKTWFASEEFEHVLQKLDSEIENLSGQNQADYASALARASSVSVPASKLFEGRIRAIMKTPLDPDFQLPEGDDRLYLSRAVKSAMPAWAYNFGIRQIAMEEVAEKARKTWAEICLANATSFQGFLSDLNSAIPEAIETIDSADPDSSFKRIRRIFSCFADDLATQDLDNGNDFGKELSNFLFKHCPQGGPESRKLRDDTAFAYVKSIRKILRLNIEANQDPGIYRIVGRIQKWWHPASPSAPIRKQIDRVSKIGSKTVFLHAKQGIQNVALRRVLNDLSGSDGISQNLKLLAENDLSLEEGISHWLSTGAKLKKAQVNEAVSNLNENRENEIFAELLVILDAPFLNPEHLEILSDTIDPIFPDEADSVNSARKNLVLAKQWFGMLVKKKGLELESSRGEIVRYAPSLHETLDTIDANAEVRVEKPGVKRSVEGRPSQIIRKPFVRKL